MRPAPVALAIGLALVPIAALAGQLHGRDGVRAIAETPAPPNVVHYPTGRYELRGDGLTTPYTWVWIPNPPPPPPPLGSAGARVPAGGSSAPRPEAEIYSWTDEDGIVHWTNRRDAVPEKYRKQAKPVAL